MKISELINKLEDIKLKAGDIDVEMYEFDKKCPLHIEDAYIYEMDTVHEKVYTLHFTSKRNLREIDSKRKNRFEEKVKAIECMNSTLDHVKSSKYNAKNVKDYVNELDGEDFNNMLSVYKLYDKDSLYRYICNVLCIDRNK